MTALLRLCGRRLGLLGLVALAACSALEPQRPPRGNAFVARQYLQRGRAAWAAGNEANARFLIGRAVELDPASEAAIGFWEARWPVDSLPAAALAAREAHVRGPAARAGEVAGDDTAPAPSGDVERSGEEPRREAQAGGPGAPGGRPARSVDAAPVTIVPAAELAALRARFEEARGAGRREELKRAGEELLRVKPRHLPTLHRVLSVWVDARVDPGEAERRIKDVLASLEFGDPAFLAGKPADLADAVYLRAYRGRFLDLLGWSAFQRGDLPQAEAALVSAEREINLRGRGDASHLRHLAAFHERRGNLARAEAYAIAAAAREAIASGEIRALASRLWARRHGSAKGLDARLAEEARRVKREERSAAIAGRLYQPIPLFTAGSSDGKTITDQSLRGGVMLLVLWEPGCEDCQRLLRDLGARGAGAPGGVAGAGQGPGGTRAGRYGIARAGVIALDVGGGSARGTATALPPGIVTATPDRPQALARGLGATVLPLTLVVEPAGFIQYRHLGYPVETAAREAWLERLGWQVESLAGLAEAGRAGARRSQPASRPPRAGGRP